MCTKLFLFLSPSVYFSSVSYVSLSFSGFTGLNSCFYIHIFLIWPLERNSKHTSYSNSLFSTGLLRMYSNHTSIQHYIYSNHTWIHHIYDTNTSIQHHIYNTNTSMQHHANILPNLTRQWELWCHFSCLQIRCIFRTSPSPPAIDDKVHYTRMPLWTGRYWTINVIIHGISLLCNALLPSFQMWPLNPWKFIAKSKPEVRQTEIFCTQYSTIQRILQYKMGKMVLDRQINVAQSSINKKSLGCLTDFPLSWNSNDRDTVFKNSPLVLTLKQIKHSRILYNPLFNIFVPSIPGFPKHLFPSCFLYKILYAADLHLVLYSTKLTLDFPS
jgi:hypothetical protein